MKRSLASRSCRLRTTVAVDASFLSVLLDKRARAAIENGPESVARLVENLSVQRAKVIIPTPALAEVLTETPGVGQFYLQRIQRWTCFQIRPFDDKAAIELAQLLGTSVTKDLLNFGRQIVAIAKVYGASTLYADEEKVAQFGAECGLRVIRFKDLQKC